MISSSDRLKDISAWIALGVMVATMLYAIVDRQVFALVAAEMSAALNLTNTQLGLIQGLGFAILTMIGAYPIAWLADRYDRRWVLAACILLWALATAACGLAFGFWSLFIAAGVVAVSEAGIAPIFMSMLPELFQGKARVTATMVYYVSVSLSMAVGMFVIGAMIAMIQALQPLPAPLGDMDNWRLAFIVAAAPFPIFIALTFLLPRGPTAGLKTLAQPAAGGKTEKPKSPPVGPFLKQNLMSVASVFGGMTCFALGATAILAWTPVSLTRIFGVSPADIGMVMGIVIAAASIAGVTAGNFIIPFLQRRIGYRTAPRVVWGSLLISIPLICLLPFTTAPWQVYACLSVQVFVSTIAGASSLSLLQDLAPPALRARIMALRAMTNGPAVGLGIASSAFLGDIIKAGPQSLFWGGVCITVPAWLSCIILMRLAEKPFEETARASTCMDNPLDVPAAAAIAPAPFAAMKQDQT